MRILFILRKDLLILLRDRGEMASLFLMPLAFIIPIALVFPPDGYNLNADRKPELPVAVYDIVNGAVGAQAQELLDLLAQSYALEQDTSANEVAQLGPAVQAACTRPGPACDEAAGREKVLRNWRTVALIVPEGFSAAIAAGERISVTLLYNPARNPVERQLAEGVLTGATMRLSIEHQLINGLRQFGDLIELAPEEVRQNIDRSAEFEAAPTDWSPALSIVAVQPSAVRIAVTPNTLQQTVPGYTVMFVYFMIGVVAASLKLERNTGALRRLMTMPVGLGELLAGKVLSALLVSVLQIGVLFAIGALFFGMTLGNAPGALALLAVAVALSAVCLGLAAAAYNFERGLTLILIVAALLAGCMFPADWLPPVLRTVNVALPQTWAMQGFQDLITRGMGLPEVLPEMAALLGFALLAFAAAVHKFNDEEWRQ
ncbi:MAG: ABC transporter permease [Caldilinea sp.]|nr:ABC transporter permease [Caldilinea sp.]MDW8438987.1 ABC transporter permease [Caldilineaceae bacterium]